MEEGRECKGIQNRFFFKIQQYATLNPLYSMYADFGSGTSIYSENQIIREMIDNRQKKWQHCFTVTLCVIRRQIKLADF